MARRIGGAGGGSDPAGKSGAVVAAGVLAVALTAGSGGLSLGGGTATTAIDSAGTNLTKARTEGRKSARKGDADTYEAAFTEPLHAGTEFVLVEDRGDWVQAELSDGRRCWLPARAVGLVRFQ